MVDIYEDKFSKISKIPEMDWFRMVLQFHRNANFRLAHKFMLHMMSWYFYFFMVRPIFVHS